MNPQMRKEDLEEYLAYLDHFLVRFGQGEEMEKNRKLIEEMKWNAIKQYHNA
jgi:hypothetical protein